MGFVKLSNRPFLLTTAAMLLSVLVGCGGPAAESGSSTGPVPASTESSKLLQPDGFARAIADPARFTINVHIPFEGALPDTDAMIPYNQIERKRAQLPPDRNVPVAVYCKSGRMSADASKALASLGYHDIIELDGGMNGWRAAGKPVQSTPPSGIDS